MINDLHYHFGVGVVAVSREDTLTRREHMERQEAKHMERQEARRRSVEGKRRAEEKGSLEKATVGGEFLGNHASDAKQGDAADVELFVGEVNAVRPVAEGVKAEGTAAFVIFLELPEAFLGIFEGGDGRRGFDDADGTDDDGPEGLQRRLLEGEVRGGVDGAAEEGVEDLGEGEPERCDHGNSAMLELGLPNILRGFRPSAQRGLRGQSRRQALGLRPSKAAGHPFKRRDQLRQGRRR